MPKIPENPTPLITSIPKLEDNTSQGTKTTPEYQESVVKGHGLVTVRRLHPFKCSKCDYVAVSAADSKDHWFDEHRD